jgi:hypothetical protein
MNRQPTSMERGKRLLQQIETTLRKDIVAGQYVSAGRWKSFQAPKTELVLKVFEVAILQNDAFWIHLARRTNNFYNFINLQAPSFQRDITKHKNIPNIAFEFWLIVQVCSDFRKHVNVFRVAIIYTEPRDYNRSLICTLQHAIRRFGISESSVRKLPRQDLFPFNTSGLFMVKFSDILRLYHHTANHCMPVVSMSQILGTTASIAKTKQDEFLTKKKSAIAKADMKSFAKQVVLTWLRSEKMDIHGRHATFAINQCIEEHTLSDTCKAFARRIYYIMSREKQRYAAYVLHYLQMGANVREASSHAMDQCCADLYALDFYVPWENLCAQVK